MLILRPTKILARRLRLVVNQPEPVPPDPYADWCVHTFFAAHVKYLLFTHTTSLVSAVAPARGVTSLEALETCFAETIRSQLHRHRLGDIWTRRIAPQLDGVILASIPNRSVLGCMNEFIFLGRAYLERGSLEEANAKLPDTPTTGIKSNWPLRAFAALEQNVAEPAAGGRVLPTTFSHAPDPVGTQKR